jgi:hypothetical protein
MDANQTEINTRKDTNSKEKEVKMDGNQAKAAKQEEILAQRSARMDKNLNEMREEIKSGQAEIRSTICAFRSELKETIQHEMKAVIQPMRSELGKTTACNEATDFEPNPGMMQSIEEHQEIPKGEAAVMPVGEPRKRRRVCNLAAERRQKTRERAQGYSESRRKSAAACRKVFRRAKVAWRKINFIRKIQIQASRESRKELAVARRDDASCKRAIAQGTRSQEIRPGQCSIENSERTDVQNETFERPGMQQWNGGSRPKTEATRQQADKGPRRQTAAVSEKRQDIHLDLQEDHRQREDREAKSWILRLVAENQGLDLVEGSTPSKMKKKNCT